MKYLMDSHTWNTDRYPQLHQRQENWSPRAKSGPLLVLINKIFLSEHSHTHELIHVCGWFQAAVAVLSSCNWGSMVHKAKDIYYLLLHRKSVPTWLYTHSCAHTHKEMSWPPTSPLSFLSAIDKTSIFPKIHVETHSPKWRYSAISRNISGCHRGCMCATGIYQVETRDATKHHRAHRTAPHDKEWSGPTFHSAEVEKLPQIALFTTADTARHPSPQKTPWPLSRNDAVFSRLLGCPSPPLYIMAVQCCRFSLVRIFQLQRRVQLVEGRTPH